MTTNYAIAINIHTDSGIKLTTRKNTLWISKGGVELTVSKVKDLWFDVRWKNGGMAQGKSSVSLSAVYDLLEDMNLGWESDADLDQIDISILDLPCMGTIRRAGLTPHTLW